MDAMIFAAGLGTRLRPLTDELPKALIDVGGEPILDHVARRLIAAGADRLIINTHPFPELIRDHVAARDGFGVEVLFSHEPDGPLDTAGGLRRAAPLFRRDGPFFLHNCDVLSDIDLRALRAAHEADRGRVATLAVLPPSPERYLIFDDDGLCGFAPRGGGEPVRARPPRGAERHRDFTGIHMAAAELLDSVAAGTASSIISHYLEIARGGARIAAYDQPGARWIDIGTPERLEEARCIHGTMAA